jgi:hypothetical protein
MAPNISGDAHAVANQAGEGTRISYADSDRAATSSAEVQQWFRPGVVLGQFRQRRRCPTLRSDDDALGASSPREQHVVAQGADQAMQHLPRDEQRSLRDLSSGERISPWGRGEIGPRS